MIQNIKLSKLFHHPDNPRRIYRDVEELADSIKESGILQNLTVVPKPEGPDDEYYVVIGNRRLEAAIIAGVEEIPCTIVTMDDKTVVATMLAENMQRDDLTLTEEAGGIQMMLDLGYTTKDIAQKTGLSVPTIDRRAKLNALDKDKLNDAVERGGTLQDFQQLDNIKDPELRNEVLEAVGTNNFKNLLATALSKEKNREHQKAIIAVLDTFATEIKNTDTNDLRYVLHIPFYNNSKFEKPEDAETREYKYVIFSNTYSSYAQLYVVPTQAEIDHASERKKEHDETTERKQSLAELSNKFYGLRHAFIAEIGGLKQKKQTVMEFAFHALMAPTQFYNNIDHESILKIIGRDVVEDEPLEEAVKQAYKAAPDRILLTAAYVAFNDKPSSGYYNHAGYYVPNENLELLYHLLKKLGYKISDEEVSLADGTHELYTPVITKEPTETGEEAETKSAADETQTQKAS